MTDEPEAGAEVSSEGVPAPPEPPESIDITEPAPAADVDAVADTAGTPEVDATATGDGPGGTGADVASPAAATPLTTAPSATAPPTPAPSATAPSAATSPDAGPGVEAPDAAPPDAAPAGGATEDLADEAPGLAGPAEASDTPPLRKVLEAILLVVDEPVPEVDLAQVVEAPRAVVLATLEELAAEYVRDGRGFELRAVAGGWRLYTAADCAPYIERFVLDGQQARLTQAALETLAVIAYRQPVSRQSVAAIRGVNVDGVVRTLLGRGLIAEAGEEGPSGAHLYVTTPYFLERLGLRSLDELPNLAPLLPVNLEDLADHS